MNGNLKKIVGILLLVLLAGCASAPKITQPELKLSLEAQDYFRKDGRLMYYFLGSRAPELSVNEVCALYVHNPRETIHNINGVPIKQYEIYGVSSIIFLPPGKHRITFSYNNSFIRYVGTGQERVTVNVPMATIETEMNANKGYSLEASLVDVTNQNAMASMERHIFGIGGRYNASVYLKERSLKPEGSNQYQNLKTERIYLEAFDSSMNMENQCLLELCDKISLIKFNDNTVNWGWKGYSATIGIPSGKNELQLVISGDENIYKVSAIDFRPGNRYVIALPSTGDFVYKSGLGKIQIKNVTTNESISAIIVGNKSKKGGKE